MTSHNIPVNNSNKKRNLHFFIFNFLIKENELITQLY